MADHVDIVFDGPPGPEGNRFIEVEDAHGRSIRFGYGSSAMTAVGSSGSPRRTSRSTPHLGQKPGAGSPGPSSRASEAGGSR